MPKITRLCNHCGNPFDVERHELHSHRFCSRSCANARINLFTEDRFWAMVDIDRPDGCWQWRGPTKKNGYPILRVGGTRLYPVKVACELLGKQNNARWLICGNRLCINPDHRGHSPPRSDLVERFWSKVDRLNEGGCWEWHGMKDKRGYGRIDVCGKPMLVHRVSFMLAYGSFDDSLKVCHHCDNPSCVRPEHLFLGDMKANMGDMAVKGRRKGRGGLRGEAHPLALLTWQAVDDIRARYACGGVKQAELAREFGVTQSTISSVVLRKGWQTEEVSS